MAAKTHTTKRIPYASGSTATGKTVPGPGSVRGGGQTATAISGKGKSAPATGTGFGNTRGVMSRKGGKSC